MAKKKTGLLMILLAIFLPPVAVLLRKGIGFKLLLNIVLSLIAVLPGSIHALYILFND
jgi:uncharacterized membrane protein YqaE (UPF0057 family)